MDPVWHYRQREVSGRVTDVVLQGEAYVVQEEAVPGVVVCRARTEEPPEVSERYHGQLFPFVFPDGHLEVGAGERLHT